MLFKVIALELDYAMINTRAEGPIPNISGKCQVDVMGCWCDTAVTFLSTSPAQEKLVYFDEKYVSTAFL